MRLPAPYIRRINFSMSKAVVLISGGLDSAVTLFFAIKKGYKCHSITFDYGQRHTRELLSARRIAKAGNSELKIIKLGLSWKGSSLLNKDMKLPLDRSIKQIKKDIPSTYVPARNTIFLSIATSFAEAIGASFVFIGAHFEDSSGYPDCRIEYLKAFDALIKLGTKKGLEGDLALRFPLIDKTKKEIIRLGASLKVPFQFTWSCYKGGDRPCMRCDSCILRAKGFRELGLKDPLVN